MIDVDSGIGITPEPSQNTSTKVLLDDSTLSGRLLELQSLLISEQNLSVLLLVKLKIQERLSQEPSS